MTKTKVIIGIFFIWIFGGLGLFIDLKKSNGEAIGTPIFWIYLFIVFVFSSFIATTILYDLEEE